MRALAIDIEDPRTRMREAVVFERSPIRIGRSALNDLWLDEPSISSWHGQIVFDERGASFVDVGSSNGSAVDDVTVERNCAVPLSAGSVVLVGPIRLRVREGSESGDDSIPPTAEHEELVTEAGASPEGATARAMNAVAQLQLLHAVLEAATPQRRAWIATLRDQVLALPAVARPKILAQLARHWPELAREPELIALAAELEVELSGSHELTPHTWYARLTGGEDARTPRGEPVPDGHILARAGVVLTAFARSWIELRRANLALAAELGVAASVAVEEQPTPEALLARLLDPSIQPSDATTEVQRSFAELAVHPVALARGAWEGALALLDELSPSRVRAEREARRAREGGLGALLPISAAELWAEHESRHAALSESERFGRVLLGARFARAYHALMGRGAEGP